MWQNFWKVHLLMIRSGVKSKETVGNSPWIWPSLVVLRWPCPVHRTLKNILELTAPSTTTPFWKCSQRPKAVVERDQTPFKGARVTERRFKGLQFKGRHVNPVQHKILVNTPLPTWAFGPPRRTDVQFIVVVWHGADKYLFVALGVGKVRSQLRFLNYSRTLSGFKTQLKTFLFRPFHKPS